MQETEKPGAVPPASELPTSVLSQEPCGNITPESAGASVDLLDEAIARIRARLDRSRPLPERLRALWAGVAAARKFGAADVVGSAFMRLAATSGLKADLGRHAEEDLRHVIRWGLLSRDPFGELRRG